MQLVADGSKGASTRGVVRPCGPSCAAAIALLAMVTHAASPPQSNVALVRPDPRLAIIPDIPLMQPATEIRSSRAYPVSRSS